MASKGLGDLVDFSECKFIRREMQFYTYYDFCDNKSAIKRLFKGLSKNGKLFYMWYIYANIHMELFYKNAIWDYLNFEDEENEFRLIELKKQYKAR